MGFGWWVMARALRAGADWGRTDSPGGLSYRGDRRQGGFQRPPTSGSRVGRLRWLHGWRGFGRLYGLRLGTGRPFLLQLTQVLHGGPEGTFGNLSQ